MRLKHLPTDLRLLAQFHFRLLLSAVAAVVSVFVLAACQPSQDRFVGTWSNTWAGKGADSMLVITSNGNGLIVKNVLASSGRIIEVHSGTVEGSLISIPSSSYFPKLLLSPDERSLSVIDSPVGVMAAFRKIP